MIDYKNLPSASSMNRLFVCPGSFWRCFNMPEIKDESAERGIKIHSVLAKEKSESELNEEETYIYNRLKTNLQRFLNDYNLQENEVYLKEDRLFYFDELDGKPLFSGKPDLILKVRDKCYVIVEFKTGKDNYPLPPFNWQLNSQTILIPDCEEGWQVIINPDKYHCYTFTKKDVCDWKIQISQRVRLIIESPENCPVVPSNECKFCRANTNCPQFQNYCLPANINANDLNKEQIANILMNNINRNLLANPKYAYQIIKKLKFVHDAFGIVKAGLKEILKENPDIFDNLITLGDYRRTIELNCKNEDLLIKFTDYLSYEDYSQCLKLDLNKFLLTLQNKIREKRGEKPLKTLNNEFKENIIAELEKDGYIITRIGERELIIK